MVTKWNFPKGKRSNPQSIIPLLALSLSIYIYFQISILLYLHFILNLILTFHLSIFFLSMRCTLHPLQCSLCPIRTVWTIPASMNENIPKYHCMKVAFTVWLKFYRWWVYQVISYVSIETIEMKSYTMEWKHGHLQLNQSDISYWI